MGIALVWVSEHDQAIKEYERAIELNPNNTIAHVSLGHSSAIVGRPDEDLLQDEGEDTYEANRSLGLPDDSRDFSEAAALLHFFVGDRPMRLLTNNPKKTDDLALHGLSKIVPVKHVTGVGDWNRRYLAAKRAWGHLIEPDDIGSS